MSLNNINFIKKSFDITKENIVLAQPLIIFMIVLSFTLAGLGMQTNRILFYVFLVANILLCTAFFAGWFYMIKQGIYFHKRVENGEYKKQEEKAEASFALGKEFFPGVGEYFLQMTGTFILYSLIFAGVVYLSYRIGVNILPNPHIDFDKLYKASASSPVEMQKYLYGLSFAQLKALNIWMLFVTGVLSLFSFITMFLFPAVFDNQKQEKQELFVLTPFLAFKRNIVFLFKNFWGAIGVIIFLFVLNTVLSILSVFFNLNIILAIIGLLISFYFMTYAVILVFLYYEERKS